MSNKCRGCSPRTNVLSYNAAIGKYNLVNEQGSIAQSSLESNSLVHGYTQILTLGKGFIAAEPYELPEIGKAKYLEPIPQLVVAMVARLKYSTTQTIAQCNSPYWVAIKDYNLDNYATNIGGRCAKYCATEELGTPPTGFQLQYVDGDDGLPCFNIPDPGQIIDATIPSGFFGGGVWGQAPLAAGTPAKDFPGVEPARYTYEIGFSGESRYDYFGYCFFGPSPYGPITRFSNSADLITTILPVNFCGPQCSSDSALFPSNWHTSKIFELGTNFPGLFRNPFFAEWVIADWDSDLYLQGKDDENFKFALPIGRFDNTCSFDPFPRAIGFGAYAVGETAWPAGEALNLNMFNWGKSGGSHKVIGSGLIDLERLAYTESTIWYDANFVPDTDIVEYVAIFPTEKNPTEWVVVSLFRMKSIEHDYDLTVDKANINLAFTEFDQINIGIKHGYYEPVDLDKGDQLLSTYLTHSYANNTTSITGNVYRYEPDNLPSGSLFGPLPAFETGNYAYDAWVLPGDALPTDITPEQIQFRHTHTILTSNISYEARPGGGLTNLALGELILTGVPVTFDLLSGAVSYSEEAATYEVALNQVALDAIEAQNIKTALEVHMQSLGPSLTADSISVLEPLLIKPIIA